ncbi:MAG: hypothetical protein Q9221_002960 [Calogaya cf. arnoldii]
MVRQRRRLVQRFEVWASRNDELKREKEQVEALYPGVNRVRFVAARRMYWEHRLKLGTLLESKTRVDRTIENKTLEADRYRREARFLILAQLTGLRLGGQWSMGTFRPYLTTLALDEGVNTELAK